MGLLHKKLKLSPHKHSGKLLPHKHTSHGALLLIVLAVGVMLVFATRSIVATALTLSSQGDINLNGKVPGPPPSQPAVITQPTDGQIFSSIPIDVTGTCPAGNNYVELYDNNILMGKTPCSNQAFAFKTDLIIGLNHLVAKVIDNLDQYGPDSPTVTVTYSPPQPPKGTIPGPSGTPIPANQLLVTAESQYYGTYQGSSFKLTIKITGGVPPYAINVDWGDHQHDVISRSAEGSFDLTHIYHHGDVFYIQLNASDSAGNKAFNQTAVYVSGPRPPKPSEIVSQYPILAVIWPLYVSSLGAVGTFWLGEKYGENRILSRFRRRK